jgi:hypothetical protein
VRKNNPVAAASGQLPLSRTAGEGLAIIEEIGDASTGRGG